MVMHFFLQIFRGSKSGAKWVGAKWVDALYFMMFDIPHVQFFWHFVIMGRLIQKLPENLPPQHAALTSITTSMYRCKLANSLGQLWRWRRPRVPYLQSFTKGKFSFNLLIWHEPFTKLACEQISIGACAHVIVNLQFAK